MKKIFGILATLSLACLCLFSAAGCANKENNSAPQRSTEQTEECPDCPECPECPDGKIQPRKIPHRGRYGERHTKKAPLPHCPPARDPAEPPHDEPPAQPVPLPETEPTQP